MKKQSFLISAAMLLALSACGAGGGDNDTQTQVGGPSATNPIDVAPRPTGTPPAHPEESVPVPAAPADAAGAGTTNTTGSNAPAATQAPPQSAPPLARTAPVNPPNAQPVGALVGCYSVTGSLPLPMPHEPTLLPAPGAALVSNYQELATSDDAGLCYANYQRELVGLPAFVSEALLAKAARNHSDYLIQNDFSGHDEMPGKPGFTGKSAFERVAYAGYATTMVGEVLAMRMNWNTQPNASMTLTPRSTLVRNLIIAPFHRIGLLGSFKSAGSGYAEAVGPSAGSGNMANRPNSCAAGAGCTYTAAEFYQTINMADSHQAASDDFLIASPYDGQADVPPRWNNTEWPNPSPGTQNKDIGYTVTLQALNRSLKLNADTFEIKDPAGAAVPCFRLDHRTPSFQTGVDLANYATGMAICTPDAPLLAATTYSVRVTGSLDNKPMDLNWSFTTQ